MNSKRFRCFAEALLKTKACSRFWTQSSIFCPPRSMSLRSQGTNPQTGAVEQRKSSEQEPLAALAFKIFMDQGRKLTYLRIYSGVLEVGADVLNVSKGTREKVSRIFQMHANKRERIERSGAGNLVAVLGLKTATTGDSICDPGRPVLLEPVEVYEPVISISVEAQTRADQEKLFDSLSKAFRRGPHVPVRRKRRYGSDNRQRHGRASPGNRSQQARSRLPCRCERRKTAGRLSRNHQPRIGGGRRNSTGRSAGRGILRRFSCICPQGKEGLAMQL